MVLQAVEIHLEIKIVDISVKGCSEVIGKGKAAVIILSHNTINTFNFKMTHFSVISSQTFKYLVLSLSVAFPSYTFFHIKTCLALTA